MIGCRITSACGQSRRSHPTGDRPKLFMGQSCPQHGLRAIEANADLGDADVERLTDLGVTHSFEREDDHLTIG